MALSILKVPSAVFLAFLAGIADFIPVEGIVLAGLPAVLMATTVSLGTALVVAAILAKPVAALYRSIERIWLKEYLNRDAVMQHERLYRAGCDVSSTSDGR